MTAALLLGTGLGGGAGAQVWVVRALAGCLVAGVLVLVSCRARQTSRLHRRLAGSEQHFRALVADANDVLLRLDTEGDVVYASPSLRRVLGYGPEDVVGQAWSRLVHEADAAVATAWLQEHRDGSRAQLRVRHRDGSALWMEAVLSGRDRGRALLSLRDIGEQVRLAAELLRAATHDGLTGLLNRTAFEAELQQRLSVPAAGPGVAVLFCDLDGFKTVNDVAGHAAGDEAIAAVARRLADVLQPDVLRSRVLDPYAQQAHVLARFGGDEFAVLCSPGTSRSEALELAEQMVAAVASPFVVAGQSFDLAVSVGVAVADPVSADPVAADPGAAEVPARPVASGLLRDADIAMYRAKVSGRGQVMLFVPAMRHELLRRIETASRVKVAIDDSRLKLHYQPQVCLADGRVLGFEALVRWRGRGGGALTPAAVIAEAESTGQIVELGRQVLVGAVTDAAAWRRAGVDAGVSVNLSPRQLDSPSLVNDVRDALALSGLPAGVLTLEVTETMVPSSLGPLDQLRALGVRLAVDDFGTGYAGLAQLRQIPADELKIDRTFLEGAGLVPERTSLLASIARMGADLGLELVCEGVESLAQARLLRGLGVGAGQGFAFAGAIPPDAVPRFVADGPFDLRDRPDADRPGRVPRMPRQELRRPMDERMV